MTLKIVKETKIDDDAWYCLYLGDKYLKGSYSLQKIENLYEEFKNNPKLFEEQKEVLKSEQLNLPLQ